MRHGCDASDMAGLNVEVMAAGVVVVMAIAAWSMIWLLQPVARRFGLLDHPNDTRKDHALPTPVTGGRPRLVRQRSQFGRSS